MDLFSIKKTVKIGCISRKDLYQKLKKNSIFLNLDAKACISYRFFSYFFANKTVTEMHAKIVTGLFSANYLFREIIPFHLGTF